MNLIDKDALLSQSFISIETIEEAPVIKIPDDYVSAIKKLNRIEEILKYKYYLEENKLKMIYEVFNYER